MAVFLMVLGIEFAAGWLGYMIGVERGRDLEKTKRNARTY